MSRLPTGSDTSSGFRTARLKHTLFFLITMSVPVIGLICVELGLRVFHYDSDLDLVVQKVVNGKKVYAINRSVARRFFASSGTVIPEPADDTFSIQKGDSTKRIFCLGESTMAGFPYDFNATAPSFLRDRLQAEFPHYTIEIVNVGLSAVGSYVVLDFIKELVNYHPDLFIIYLGHNEFYGVYGSGSSVRIPGGYWVTRIVVSFLRFKTFLLLRDAYAWIREHLAASPRKEEGTLMAQMIGDQYIPYGSPEYKYTLENYERNLKAIIGVAQSAGISIVFSSLVSNLKDDPPFHGMFDPTDAADLKSRWKAALARADSLFAAKVYASAETLYKTCTVLDTANAVAFFKLGQAQYAQGEYTEALSSFKRAKDLDGLRFRASEDFERALASTCASTGAVLAPTDSAFEENSEHHIIGTQLILEHLHPNIDGYFLMGKVFAQTLQDHHLLFSRTAWDSCRLMTDEECRSISGVTAFDRDVGAIKVAYMTHEWPFESRGNSYSYAPKNEVESIALQYVQEKVPWSTARYDLAEYYARQHDYADAREECFAVSKVIPFSYQPLLRIADYYEMEGKNDSAAIAYRTCYERQDNPYARLKLAVVLLEKEQPAEANHQLEAALGLAEKNGITLTNKERAFSYYLLGVANAKLGEFDLAREYATNALSVDPTLSEATGLLTQLNSMHKR